MTGDVERLWTATNAFIGWLKQNGVASHDPYDLWGTDYGVFARRVYYSRRRLGELLVAPLIAADVLVPALARRFVSKQRFATAEAQLALAFVNLYRLTGDETHLHSATELTRGLLNLSIPGYSGYCWGYPFDWQNNQGLWKKNTPYITATPYCFEAFLACADTTGDPWYLDVADSIATFVANDLRDTPTSQGSAAGSYSPHDNTLVINASAYRAFVLFEASRRFGNDRFRAMAQRNLAFVLNSQRPDGSWLYALASPGERFIDHFHTCFVLKNLVKITRVIESAAAAEAIRRGVAFYHQELFHESGAPKSFAVEPRLQLATVELYNFAEAITLGALLDGLIPEAVAWARRLSLMLVNNYQLSDGHFVTRVYRGGLRHKTPFMRWPQAQLFLSLTNILTAIENRNSAGSAERPSDTERAVAFR